MQKREREVHPLLAKEVESAAAIVANGGVILYPTDTVWGIGCDATNAAAVAKVFDMQICPADSGDSHRPGRGK